MRYLKWKLSEGTSGTGPEVELNLVNKITVGSYVDSDGYRIGYVPDFDISGVGADWNVTELTEAEALAFCQQFYDDAEVTADGRISSLEPPEELE
jgi:hypothetical protein